MLSFFNNIIMMIDILTYFDFGISYALINGLINQKLKVLRSMQCVKEAIEGLASFAGRFLTTRSERPKLKPNLMLSSYSSSDREGGGHMILLQPATGFTCAVAASDLLLLCIILLLVARRADKR